MGIEVALTVAESLLVTVAVLQVIGDVGFAFFLHHAKRVEESEGRVRLGRGREIDGRQRQREPSLRQADTLKGLPATDDDGHGLRIGHADILPGKDGHAPENEARVFPGIDHPGHPVEGGIGVGTAQTLDEGRDGVVMNITVLVIEHGPALDRLLGHLQVDGYDAFLIRRRGLHRQFQRIEHAARVSIGHIHQMVERLRPQVHVPRAVTPLRVV